MTTQFAFLSKMTSFNDVFSKFAGDMLKKGIFYGQFDDFQDVVQCFRYHRKF